MAELDPAQLPGRITLDSPGAPGLFSKEGPDLHSGRMESDVGVRAPSPAMGARIAAGFVAVAALESSGHIGVAWVWVLVVATGVLLFLGVEQLCRRYVRGGRRGEVLRSADLLAAAVAAVAVFAMTVLIDPAKPDG